MKKKFAIQTYNQIAQVGLDQFPKELYSINDSSLSPDAILLRSHDLHRVEIPDSVSIIARAGAGINNIPIEAVTEKGIVVENTPGANANAVKELVITGLLLASRNICQAWSFVRQIQGDDDAFHKQVEQQKHQFVGYELPNKTLGVIGLGHIGVRVANAALQLGMHVIGYDPAISVKHAWQLSSQVQKADHFNEILTHSDFVTIHVPYNSHTHHLINKKNISLMKKNSVLLNFSRDEIVDQEAILGALASDQIHYYVNDFPHKNLQNHPRIIALPHIGASTREAEENCAVMAAQQVKSFLEEGHILHSVNFPDIKMPHTEGSRISIINQNVPNMVAQISTVLSQENINIIDMINKSRDRFAYTLIDINHPIDDAIFKKLNAIDGVIKVREIS